MANKIKIAPSILSADFGHLQDDIERVKSAEYLHVDVMDGHFVNNITIGPCVLKSIKTDLFKDVHLMIENPEKYIDDFVKAGADGITVHAETCKNLKDVIKQIHDLGLKAAVSLNPDSKLDMIDNVIDEVEMVLLMTVVPGFGGQSFIEKVLDKIKELRSRKKDLDIQVDGGINDQTVKKAVEAGANIIVAGSYIFGNPKPEKAIETLRNAV